MLFVTSFLCSRLFPPLYDGRVSVEQLIMFKGPVTYRFLFPLASFVRYWVGGLTSMTLTKIQNKHRFLKES